MSGLGGLNKSPDGVVLGLVQLQLPNVATPDDVIAQTQKICTCSERRLPPSLGRETGAYRWNLLWLSCAHPIVSRCAASRNGS